VKYTVYINIFKTDMAEQTTNGDAPANPDVEMKEESAPEVQPPRLASQNSR
jgi:hypothetical protein